MKRAECKGGHRPCPLVSCKYHLIWDQLGKGESKRLTASNKHGGKSHRYHKLIKYLGKMKDSCVLDVIDTHDEGMRYADIGATLTRTRQAIEMQMNDRLLPKMSKGHKGKILNELYDDKDYLSDDEKIAIKQLVQHIDTT